MNPSPSILRRFSGPQAHELFLLCRPEPSTDVAHQTKSAYRQMQEMLCAHGGALEHVVQETVFFRDIRADLDGFRNVRSRALGEAGFHAFHPASTFIEQPPLDEGVRVEVSAYAVIPHRQQAVGTWNVWGTPPCGCTDCDRVGARVFVLGGHEHLHAGNIYGVPGTAFDEAYSMFCAAEELLRQEGISFQEVIRTWIYLRDIDRDYDELNKARRVFFQHRGVRLHPASTGIRGAPFPREHNFSLGVYAIKAPGPLAVGAMTTPTLNEAWMYGSDFSRGLKVVEANKVALYVSGTASVDEEGRTAHEGDFAGQAERMIVNVETLLAAQNATVRDLVSAITYLKHPADASLLRKILHERGLEGFPNALVHAPVCRPNLLCEMEAIAALPRPA